MFLSRSVLMAVALLAGAGLRAQMPVGLRPTPGPSSGSALLAGRVADAETSTPVAAAVVSLQPAGTPNSSSAMRVLTDSLGRFFFSGLGPGRYTLTASKPGWLSGGVGQHRPDGESVPLEVKADDRRSDVSLVLWRTAVIAGRVIDEASEPLVGVDVRAFERTFTAGRAQWRFAARALTDDRGMYRLASLKPGDYLVAVPATVTSEPAALAAQNQTPDTYFETMTAVGAAPMSFRRATAAIRGSQTRLSSVLGPPQLPSGDGPWPTYPTTFFPAAGTVSAATIVQAVSGHERSGVDIAMRPTSTWQVSGTLSLPDGTPAPLHAVHLLPADSADHPVIDAATAVTDATGRFTFLGVAPGTYVVRVVRLPAPGAGWHQSICGGTGAIEFICSFQEGPPKPDASVSTDPLLFVEHPLTVDNRHVRDLALTLRPGSRMSGRVIFDGSTPPPTDAQLATLRVLLEPANGQTFTGAAGFDPTPPGRVVDGQFTTPSTWPGRYLVRADGAPSGWTFEKATWQGRDISQTPVDLAQDVSEVVLTFTDRPATIAGTVQAARGGADDAARVLIFPADRNGWVDYGRQSHRVNSAAVTAGRFELPQPPAGDYLLIAIPDDQAAGWQNPAFLARLAGIADRITVAGDRPITHALITRPVP
jgi:protocatechuate 3,4-dioxygenase beta subunit